MDESFNGTIIDVFNWGLCIIRPVNVTWSNINDLVLDQKSYWMEV